jgi:hypothetical protein
MDIVLIALGLTVWFALTVAGFYLMSFWFDMNLLRLGWEAVALIAVVYMLVIGLLDVFVAGYCNEPSGLILATVHVVALFIVGINHERIWHWVKYPYRN